VGGTAEKINVIGNNGHKSATSSQPGSQWSVLSQIENISKKNANNESFCRGKFGRKSSRGQNTGTSQTRYDKSNTRTNVTGKRLKKLTTRDSEREDRFQNGSEGNRAHSKDRSKRKEKKAVSGKIN